MVSKNFIVERGKVESEANICHIIKRNSLLTLKSKLLVLKSHNVKVTEYFVLDKIFDCTSFHSLIDFEVIQRNTDLSMTCTHKQRQRRGSISLTYTSNN